MNALTTGIEDVTGTANNDTFTGLIAPAADDTTTLNALDEIDGGDGADSLTLNVTKDYAGELENATFTGIETFNVRSSDDLGTAAAANEFDVSGISDLTTLNVTQADNLGAIAAATTDVNVSGIASGGTVDVVGGKDVDVNVSDAGIIEVGEASALGTTNAAGSVSVTAGEQANAITVDGGTDVTITATTEDANSGDIVVGGNTESDGAVAVTQNVTETDAANGYTAGDVTVTGGSTIDITANLENTASAGNANDLTAGTYTATAGDTTSAVTITQNNVANDFDGSTTGATNETAVVTFGALKAGEAVVVSEGAGTVGTDLTFVAEKALTAEEVAAAVANLTNGDTQAAGGPVVNGTYEGTLDAGWTSSAVSGNQVTFTSTATGNKTDLQVTAEADNTAGATADDATNAADFSVNTTDGSAGTTVAAQDIDATDGAVVVDDNATASITTVTLDGFNGATIGAGGSMDALTDLSLTDGAGTTNLTTAQTSLNLTLNGMAAASALNLDTGGASIATLNVTATGAASDVDFTAGAATTVNVTADADLDVSGGTFAAATDIDVVGAGDVTLDDVSAAATDITASTATGDISATVDNSTNVATGSGADTITIEATATNDIDGTVNLGAGNDTLVLDGDNNAVPTGTVDGGADIDTVSMTISNAAAYDANTNFSSAVDNFERLLINDSSGGNTIDLKNLGFNYVTTSGTTGALVLDNFQADGTVALTAAQTGSTTAQLEDATGASDSFNVVVNNSESNVQGAQAAVYTLDLTGIDLNLTGGADTFEIDGKTVYTATAGGEGASVVAGAIDGDTVKLSDGVTYLIDSTTPAAVTLTAQTNVDTTGNLSMSVTSNSTAGATAPSDTDVDLTTDGFDGVDDTKTADLDVGTLTVDDVETVNVSSNDLTTSEVSEEDENTLQLDADTATKVVVSGAADLDLTTTAPNLETLDASGMTGKLTYTADTASETVLGGSAGDSITLAANGVDVDARDGDDTLIITDNVDQLTLAGGSGDNTFDFNGASSNKSNYAVISDADAGDLIDLAGVDGNSGGTQDIISFENNEITLSQGATETTQAFLDQAIADLGAGEAGWFTTGGNTFIAADVSGSGSAFQDGQDFVVMLTGVYDLSTASFNVSNDTLEIA